jgi:hypothetical protein
MSTTSDTPGPSPKSSGKFSATKLVNLYLPSQEKYISTLKTTNLALSTPEYSVRWSSDASDVVDSEETGFGPPRDAHVGPDIRGVRFWPTGLKPDGRHKES